MRTGSSIEIANELSYQIQDRLKKESFLGGRTTCTGTLRAGANGSVALGEATEVVLGVRFFAIVRLFLAGVGWSADKRDAARASGLKVRGLAKCRPSLKLLPLRPLARTLFFAPSSFVDRCGLSGRGSFSQTRPLSVPSTRAAPTPSLRHLARIALRLALATPARIFKPQRTRLSSGSRCSIARCQIP